MNKVQKFLQTMKHNWDWSISGSKKFEKAMLQVAEDLLFVKVNNARKFPTNLHVPVRIGTGKALQPFAIGLNTQGLGAYWRQDTLQRYEIKALGLYGAMSKNWKSPLGNIGLHTGMNHSFLETKDGDSDLNLFFGLDLEFNPEFSFLLEYNSALNENEMTARTMSISKGGYLNAAFRWSFVESLHLELHLNNLLFDDEKVDYFKRELKITYIEYFQID